MQNDYQKILVLQPDHIGDVLLSTPMIHALRQKFPESQIDILVGSWAKPIVEHNKDINNIHVLNFKQFNRGNAKAPQSKIKTFYDLKYQKYDLCVMARSRNRLIRLFAWATGIPNLIGFEAQGKDNFLTIKVKQQNLREHIVMRNMRIAEALGADISNPELVLEFSEADQKKAQQIIEGAQKPIIGVNPGAGTKAKQWPASKFAKLVQRLSQEKKATVVITGSPAEVDLANNVARKSGVSPIIAAGQTSLLELAALQSKLDLYISNDSGPMHMAAAVGTPVIDLHSGTDYPSMWRPWGDEHTVLSYAEKCDKLPCFKTECDYFNHGCLDLISVDEVVSTVQKYLFS